MNSNFKKYIYDIAFVIFVATAIALIGWLTHYSINKCKKQASNYQKFLECINL